MLVTIEGFYSDFIFSFDNEIAPDEQYFSTETGYHVYT